MREKDEVNCVSHARLTRNIFPMNRGQECPRHTIFPNARGRGRPRHTCLRLLRWPQQNLADKRLRGLRHQHCHDMGYILRLEHLRFIFSGVWA
jgi:hypothetical protein